MKNLKGLIEIKQDEMNEIKGGLGFICLAVMGGQRLFPQEEESLHERSNVTTSTSR